MAFLVNAGVAPRLRSGFTVRAQSL